MIVAGSANPLLLGQSQGYNLTKSLRFRSSASAYLNRTPASAGNRKTWTFSAWVKRGALSGDNTILNAGYSTIPWFILAFASNNTLAIAATAGSTASWKTAAVFRDSSAWYHVVLAVDTTSATSTMNGSSTDRFRLYVNGTQYVISGGTVPTQNSDLQVNNTVSHTVGGYSGEYFDGYMTEINFIDGQALTPSSFGQTSSTTGVWQPIKYTGTYGTNGFYLPFTNTTSTSTLGNDFSGNSNTWTVNNISLTSGTTYDSMTDVPTNTNSNTANYAVMNPLNKASLVTVTDGNLTLSPSSASWGAISGTVAVTSGKWYYEYSASISSALTMCGWATTDEDVNTTYGSAVTKQWVMYLANGNKYGNGSNAVSYASAVSANTVVGVALDMDAGTLTFYIGGVSQGTAFSTGLTGKTLVPWIPVNSGAGAFSGYVNFGQRPFAYTPPSGFYPLNTYNLPTPTILDGDQYFDVVLYTGNGTSQSITSLGFTQDFTWIKMRSSDVSGRSNILTDTIRGATKTLISDDTSAETTDANDLSAFLSNGFSVGSNARVNGSSKSMVAWNWKANGSGSSNTQGTITSTVSANTTAGFSIVTYASTTGTVGHGLGVAPSMIIMKARNLSDQWTVGHVGLPSWSYGLALNSTAAQDLNTNFWNATAPTSTVFSQGSWDSGYNKVAYCFAAVAGYSAFGSYTGNGSSDGPFVYTGFRPRYVMFKRTDVANDWVILDTARNTFNVMTSSLFPNSASAETSNGFYDSDMLSNGIKIRSANAVVNANGGTYIYAAFAESPFKYANAR